MNCLFKVYLIKRHALYHVLESLYLWESLEDKENNHSDISYRFILLWKRYRDGGRDGSLRENTWDRRHCLLRIQSRREKTDAVITAETQIQLTLILTSLSHFPSFLSSSSAWILSYRISDDYWQKSNKLMLIKMMFVDKTWWNKIRNDNWVKRSWKWRIKRH